MFSHGLGGNKKGPLGILYYGIFWKDELLTATRKVELVEDYTACFENPKSGISMLNLILWSNQEERRITKLQREKQEAKGTWSTADKRKLHRRSRTPSSTCDQTVALYTTWALFIEMLFGKKNAHLISVNEVRRTLMTISKVQSRLEPIYFADMT